MKERRGLSKGGRDGRKVTGGDEWKGEETNGT